MQQQANEAQAQQMVAEANQAAQQQPLSAPGIRSVDPSTPPPVNAPGQALTANLSKVADVVDTAYDLATKGR